MSILRPRQKINIPVRARQNIIGIVIRCHVCMIHESRVFYYQTLGTKNSLHNICVCSVSAMNTLHKVKRME